MSPSDAAEGLAGPPPPPPPHTPRAHTPRFQGPATSLQTWEHLKVSRSTSAVPGPHFIQTPLYSDPRSIPEGEGDPSPRACGRAEEGGHLLGREILVTSSRGRGHGHPLGAAREEQEKGLCSNCRPLGEQVRFGTAGERVGGFCISSSAQNRLRFNSFTTSSLVSVSQIRTARVDADQAGAVCRAGVPGSRGGPCCAGSVRPSHLPLAAHSGLLVVQPLVSTRGSAVASPCGAAGVSDSRHLIAMICLALRPSHVFSTCRSQPC